MKQFTLFLAFLLAMFLGGHSGSYAQEKSGSAKATQTTKLKSQKGAYSCPMHPEFTSDKPGDCPKCGMALEKVKTNESPKQSDEEMATTCTQMCEMMKKDPSMMKKMHDQMMKDMEESPSDSTRMEMGQKSTKKSCCGMMKGEKK